MNWMKKYSVCLGIIISAISLDGATVSVVNQTPVSTLGGTAYSGMGTTVQTPLLAPNQAGQNDRAAIGPQSGKLPVSKTARSARRPRAEAVDLKTFVEEPVYTFPGMLARVGRKWVGSDYLYDLPGNIGIKVEVVSGEGIALPIDTGAVSGVVAEIFQRGGLTPESLAGENRPPLPFFHILIFTFGDETQNVAYVAGRLFEDALLARYDLEPLGTWQVISWEKQDLVITSPLQFEDQFMKTVINIAETFVNRVETYARIKEESESNSKLYYPSAIPLPRKSAPPQVEEAPSALEIPYFRECSCF